MTQASVRDTESSPASGTLEDGLQAVICVGRRDDKVNSWQFNRPFTITDSVPLLAHS